MLLLTIQELAISIYTSSFKIEFQSLRFFTEAVTGHT